MLLVRLLDKRLLESLLSLLESTEETVSLLYTIRDHYRFDLLNVAAEEESDEQYIPVSYFDSSFCLNKGAGIIFTLFMLSDTEINAFGTSFFVPKYFESLMLSQFSLSKT